MIKRVQIYGERNSGTNFLQRLVEQNFKDISITWQYGWKHWFPQIKGDTSDVLFLSITRNAFDWLRSFNKTPFHTIFQKMDFSTFIRQEFFSVYNFHDNIPKDNPLYGCELMKDRNPETGERFKNVIELRNYKNKYFVEKLSEKVQYFEHLNYEELNKNNEILAKIAKKYDIELLNKKIKQVEHYKGNVNWGKYEKKQYEEINKRDITFILNNLDLKFESKLGHKYDNYQS